MKHQPSDNSLASGHELKAPPLPTHGKASAKEASHRWHFTMPEWVTKSIRSKRNLRVLLRCSVACWAAYVIILPNASLRKMGTLCASSPFPIHRYRSPFIVHSFHYSRVYFCHPISLFSFSFSYVYIADIRLIFVHLHIDDDYYNAWNASRLGTRCGCHARSKCISGSGNSSSSICRRQRDVCCFRCLSVLIMILRFSTEYRQIQRSRTILYLPRPQLSTPVYSLMKGEYEQLSTGKNSTKAMPEHQQYMDASWEQQVLSWLCLELMLRLSYF